MKSLKILIATFLFLFVLGGIFGSKEVQAEIDPSLFAAQLVQLDEDVKPDDLGVKEPRLLPGNPFYFFKGIARGIRSAFTFNPVSRAELKLKFSNEKLMEARKLAERKPEVLAKALKNYQKETERLAEKVERIEKTVEDPRVDKFMDKFIDQGLKHQKLLGRFEREVPPEFHETIDKVKEGNLEKFSDIGLKFAPPEVFKEKIVEIGERMPGSDFRHFKNVEILQEIEERAPEEAKEALREAKERFLDRFKDDFEKMEEEKREMFHHYVEQIGGNEVRHLSVLDEFEREEMPKIIREEMARAKEKIFERVEERLKEYEERNLARAREEFLDHLTEFGRMEDLRIVKELENNLSPAVMEQILEVKRKTEKKLIENIERMETPEEQKELLGSIEDKFHDVRQFEVFKEMEEFMPPENKEFFEEMKEKAMERMEEEVERAKMMKEEERRMVLEKLAGDSPEHIKVFKEFGPSPIMMKEIIKGTTERISARTEFVEDPEKLEFLKRRIEEEEEIQEVFERERPEIFEKFEERETAMMETLKPEKAREQIERAKETVRVAEEKIGFLDVELQKEVLEKGPYSSLMREAKDHLAKAERALTGEFYGEAFAGATAAWHNASNALRKIDEIQRKRFFEEERRIKFERVFEEVRKERPTVRPPEAEARPPEITIEQVVPTPGKVFECPIPIKPRAEACEGEWMMEKTPEGCPMFVCRGAEKAFPCARAGEKVNRDPSQGPTHQRCCPDLEEIRVNEFYGLCKKEIRIEIPEEPKPEPIPIKPEEIPVEPPPAQEESVGKTEIRPVEPIEPEKE